MNLRKNSSRRQESGFTLIELLVTIAIIGILISVGYAVYSNTQGKARDARRKADIDAIAKAYEANYNSLKNKYSALNANDFVNGKVPKPPENPYTNYDGFNSTQYFDSTTKQGNKWMVCTRLEGQTANTPCIQSSATCYCKSSSQGNVITDSDAISSTTNTIISPTTGGIVASTTLPGLPDTLGGWTATKNVAISNNGGALTNYQIRISVSYATGMKSDFGDIRFADSGGTSELPYWIESVNANSSAVFWVKVPSVPNGSSTIKLVYGNTSATTTSNPETTFDIYDNFDGTTLNTSKWTRHGSAPLSVSNSRVSMSGGGDGVIRSTASVSLPAIVEANVISIGSQYTTLGLVVPNTFNGYTITYTSDGYMHSMVASPNCNGTYGGSWSNGTTYYSNYRLSGIWRVRWVSNKNQMIYWPGASSDINSYYTNYNSTTASIVAGTICSNSYTSMVIDWIRARKYTSVEPTATVQ